MIIALHYILFSAGTPPIIILISLYIEKYSGAALSELGVLLMLLPFLSMILKPIVCALADRQQAHRQYLIGSLLLFALGYGSLTIIPFFPDFYKNNGRLCWYLDTISMLVGSSGFGVAWSLGDALAVKRANVRGIPWGSYRVWATIAWGVSGFLVGQINEMPCLPIYTPGLFLLMLTAFIEIILLAVWDKEHFDMNALEYSERMAQQEAAAAAARKGSLQSSGTLPGPDESNQAPQPGWQGTFRGTPGGTLKSSVRMNSRLAGALANIVMEDVKSSLRLGAAPRRQGLAELLQEQVNYPASKLGSVSGPTRSPLVASASLASPYGPAPVPAASTPLAAVALGNGRPPVGGGGSPKLDRPTPPENHTATPTTTDKLDTLGRSGTARRARLMLERMNSLSSITGHAIASEITSKLDSQPEGRPAAGPQMMVMSSLASSASLSRAAAAGALGLSLKESPALASAGSLAVVDEQHPAATKYKSVDDLQLILLKLIIKRDLSIYKYLLMFVLLGGLLQVHLLYFFMHLEIVALRGGYNFSQIAGVYTVAQSVSEVFTFLIIVPKLMPVLGRTGSFLFIALVYLVRYVYYATYFDQLSPYWAVITEVCHGLGYGVVYSLITEISVEFVDQVDRYVPELIRRGLVAPEVSAHELKLPLRATMQGLFSGAFDGCGFGLGAVLAGAYLDLHPSHVDLWAVCSYILVAIMLVYPLVQWRDFVPARAQASRKRPGTQVAA